MSTPWNVRNRVNWRRHWNRWTLVVLVKCLHLGLGISSLLDEFPVCVETYTILVFGSDALKSRTRELVTRILTFDHLSDFSCVIVPLFSIIDLIYLRLGVSDVYCTWRSSQMKTGQSHTEKLHRHCQVSRLFLEGSVFTIVRTRVRLGSVYYSWRRNREGTSIDEV